jgi:hypothetical protein
MTGVLFGDPQSPDSWEVAALVAVGGLFVVLSIVLYLAHRRSETGKGGRAG